METPRWEGGLGDRLGPGECPGACPTVRTGLEWLETNGLGGFACSTIPGANTRRYHGLLTAALRPPVARYLLLSKLEETLVIDGRRYDLSVNLYAGAVHPQGHRYLKHFTLDPFPRSTYQVEGFEIEKRVFMVHGENTTVVEYELAGLDRGPVPACYLEIRPLIAFRDYHSLTHANGDLNPNVDVEAGIVSMQPYDGLPRLYLAHNADAVQRDGNWYYNFDYPVERERGLDDREDLFCPLMARFDFNRGPCAILIASTERRDCADAPVLRASEIERRKRVVDASPSADALVTALVAAADSFIVQRGDLKTVIAGYHWFTDWGRDTMIALPGLTLVTGRHDIARRILLAFVANLDRGMLPNRFPDAGETPEYNTADATLWFFEAIRSYVAYTGDIGYVRQHLYQRLRNIIDWHLRGTRYGIRVDEDGLLMAGEPGVQLTWMDAKIGAWVVTPRHGKPVEIQALWYNALRVTEEFARQFGDEEAVTLLAQLAGRAAASFNRVFWNEQAGCLYDVVNGDFKDASIRPNQVIAVSLHHSLVSRERARRILGVVERELLTPYGLRTLSPADPNYRGRYEGAPSQRDAVYHQGTVWPWLLGPFITAFVKSSEDRQRARERAGEWLGGFCDHLHQGCLGTVAEIFDGDAPHAPRGAVAQAWSVAELLRAAVEDVHGSRPSPIAPTLRPALSSDEPFVYRLVYQTLSEQLGANTWDPQTRDPLLDLQIRAKHESYTRDYPNASTEIVMLNGEPVGRIIVDRSGEFVQLVDIAILPGRRGAGIGTKVLLALCAEAESMPKNLRLSVSVTNPRAASLYSRLGFRVIAKDQMNLFMERISNDRGAAFEANK